MPIADRLKSFFREVPMTAFLIYGNTLIWLLYFFGLTEPMLTLGGSLDLAHAWRWLTYPLASLTSILGLVIGMFVFYLFSGSLERRWGTHRFARIFVVLTLLCVGAQWLTLVILSKVWNPPVEMSGLGRPGQALFLIWCSLHREESILAYMIIPIKAKYLAAVTILFTFFDIQLGPVASLPMTGLLVACWFWAERYGGASTFAPRPASSGRSLGQWWSDRQKAKRKGRFQVLEGGTPAAVPTRVGSLKSLSKTPAPKDPEPAEKELNRILDKIRFEGMSSLTESERATLDSQSRRLRGDA